MGEIITPNYIHNKYFLKVQKNRQKKKAGMRKQKHIQQIMKINRISTAMGGLSCKLCFANLFGSKNLDISSQDIDVIPISIYENTGLIELDASGNQLRSIPNTISRLINLQTLNLRYNMLEYLCEDIERLNKLQTLRLDNNQLYNLPDRFTLQSLEILDLSQNFITELPSSLGGCINLVELNLRRNKLTNLPSSLGALIKLKVLDIQYNPHMNLAIQRISLKSKKSSVQHVIQYLQYRMRPNNTLLPRFQERKIEKGQIVFYDRDLNINLKVDPRYYMFLRAEVRDDRYKYDMTGDPFIYQVTKQGTNGHETKLELMTQPMIRCDIKSCNNYTVNGCPYHYCTSCCKNTECPYHSKKQQQQQPFVEVDQNSPYIEPKSGKRGSPGNLQNNSKRSSQQIKQKGLKNLDFNLQLSQYPPQSKGGTLTHQQQQSSSSQYSPLNRTASQQSQSQLQDQSPNMQQNSHQSDQISSPNVNPTYSFSSLATDTLDVPGQSSNGQQGQSSTRQRSRTDGGMSSTSNSNSTSVSNSGQSSSQTQQTNQDPHQSTQNEMSVTEDIPQINPNLPLDLRINMLRRFLEMKRPQEPQKWSEKPRMKCQVRRKTLLEDSFTAFMNTNPDKLKLRLNIQFMGEDGIDYGGLTREWFSLILPEVTDANYALFIGGRDTDSYIYSINPLSSVNQDHLQYFRFVGRVLGKALYENHLVNIHFSHLVYKCLLNQPFMLSDLEPVDADAYRSLIYVSENDPTDLMLDFTVTFKEFDQVKEIELKPGGKDIEVTQENKVEYIQLMIEHKLTYQIFSQMKAMQKGFHDILPEGCLYAFTPAELELMLCGVEKIDVDDWKQNTEYTGMYYMCI
ncbi:MAG: putative E3 ubiquitin-protein ligase SMURF2 [Streblomastix strix]|uniref:HECT-type E3 ubiquitin transferase n=1 Tax=Streblomastix strix TaxID=222440 RepID=A0A5J4WSP6_9EUKA|nr:MAG: putative E3 ubiquitin-protein ligase SMURF2 [Streblomastix strix]